MVADSFCVVVVMSKSGDLVIDLGFISFVHFETRMMQCKLKRKI